MADLIRAWPGNAEEYEAILVPNKADPYFVSGAASDGTIGLIFPVGKGLSGAPVLIYGKHGYGNTISFTVDNVTTTPAFQAAWDLMRDAIFQDLITVGDILRVANLGTISTTASRNTMFSFFKKGEKKFNFLGLEVSSTTNAAIYPDFVNLFTEGNRLISAKPITAPRTFVTSGVPNPIWVCGNVHTLIGKSGRMYVIYNSFTLPFGVGPTYSDNVRGRSVSIWANVDNCAHLGSFWACIFQDDDPLSDIVSANVLQSNLDKIVGATQFTTDSDNFPVARLGPLAADIVNDEIYYLVTSRLGSASIFSVDPLDTVVHDTISYSTGSSSSSPITLYTTYPIFAKANPGDVITISPGYNVNNIDSTIWLYTSWKVLSVESDYRATVTRFRAAPASYYTPPSNAQGSNVICYLSLCRRRKVSHTFHLHDGSRLVTRLYIDPNMEEAARKLYYGFASSAALAIGGNNAVVAYTGKHSQYDPYSLRVTNVRFGESSRAISKSYSVGTNGSILGIEVRQLNLVQLLNNNYSIVGKKALVFAHNTQVGGQDDIGAFLRPYADRTVIKFTSGPSALVNLGEILLDKVIDVVFNEPNTQLSSIAAKHISIMFFADDVLETLSTGQLPVTNNTIAFELFPSETSDLVNTRTLSIPLSGDEQITSASMPQMITSVGENRFVCYVCTDKGRIFLSLDLGNTWNECYSPCSPGRPLGVDYIRLNKIYTYPCGGSVVVNNSISIINTGTYFNGMRVYRLSGIPASVMRDLNAFNLSYVLIGPVGSESSGGRELSGLFFIPPAFQNENGDLLSSGPYAYQNAMQQTIVRGSLDNSICIASREDLTAANGISNIKITPMPTAVAVGDHGTILLSEGGIVFKAIAAASDGTSPKYLRQEDMYPGYMNDFGDVSFTALDGEMLNPRGLYDDSVYTYRAPVFHRRDLGDFRVVETQTPLGSVYFYNSRGVPNEAIIGGNNQNYWNYPHGIFVAGTDSGDVVFMFDIVRNKWSRPDLSHGRNRINDVAILRYKLSKHMLKGDDTSGTSPQWSNVHPVVFALPRQVSGISSNLFVAVIRRTVGDQPVLSLDTLTAAGLSSTPSEIPIINYSNVDDILFMKRILYGSSQAPMQRLVAVDRQGNLFFIIPNDYTDDEGTTHEYNTDRKRSIKRCSFVGLRLASTGLSPIGLAGFYFYGTLSGEFFDRTILLVAGRNTDGINVLKAFACTGEPVYRKLNNVPSAQDAIKLSRARDSLYLNSSDLPRTAQFNNDDGLYYIMPSYGGASYSNTPSFKITAATYYVRDMDSYLYSYGSPNESTFDALVLFKPANIDVISQPIFRGMMFCGSTASVVQDKFYAYHGVSIDRAEDGSILLSVLGLPQNGLVTRSAVLLFKGHVSHNSFMQVAQIGVSRGNVATRSLSGERGFIPHVFRSPDNYLYITEGFGHITNVSGWRHSAKTGLAYPIGEVDRLIDKGVIMTSSNAYDGMDGFSKALVLGRNVGSNELTWPFGGPVGQTVWPLPPPVFNRSTKFTKYGFAIAAVPCITTSVYPNSGAYVRHHDQIAVLVGCNVSTAGYHPVPIIPGTMRWLGCDHLIARFDGLPDVGDSYIGTFWSPKSASSLVSRSPSQKMLCDITLGNSSDKVIIDFYSPVSRFLVDSAAAIGTNFRRLVVQVAKPSVTVPPQSWGANDYHQFVLYSTVNNFAIGASSSFTLTCANSSTYTNVVRVQETLIPGIFKPGRRRYYACIRGYNQNPSSVVAVPIIDNTKNELLLASPVAVSGPPNSSTVQIICDRFYGLLEVPGGISLRDDTDNNGNPLKATTGIRFIIEANGSPGIAYQAAPSSGFEISKVYFGLSSLYKPILGKESRRRPSRGFQQELLPAFERIQSPSGHSVVQLYNDRPRLRLTLEYNDALWHDRDASLSQLLPYLVDPVILAFNVKDCNSVDLVELEEQPVITNTHGDRYTYTLKFVEVI
ncbi:MAG: hypothetical protein QXT45_05525 [Candidatus Bilamarchaeaceae archaeon]